MTVRIWEVATGKEIVRMAHESSVRSVTFSGDGKYVVSGSDDKTARVWESTTGKEIARLTHEGAVNSVAFSPDSKYVVSGSTDSTARVWEVTTGKEIARMVHEGTVNSVTFSPNSKYVVSAECGPENWNQPCSQSSIRVWIWNPDDLIAEACSRVTRNLTRAEWQLYISDALPYQAVCPNLPIEPEPTFTPTP
jgi:WD40 repeat protein